MLRLQPVDAISLGLEQNFESLVDAEHSGNPGQHVDIEREGAVFARLLAPFAIGRARGIAKHETAFLLA